MTAGGAFAVPFGDPPAPKVTEIGPKVGDEAKDFELAALGGEKVNCRS